MTVYVEAEKAARELGVRARGGFFADDADEDYALALVDGAFAKALVVHIVRKVDGKTFYEARAASRMLLISIPIMMRCHVWTEHSFDALGMHLMRIVMARPSAVACQAVHAGGLRQSRKCVHRDAGAG